MGVCCVFGKSMVAHKGYPSERVARKGGLYGFYGAVFNMPASNHAFCCIGLGCSRHAVKVCCCGSVECLN